MKIAVDQSKNFTFQYFKQISLISSLIDVNDIDKLATELKNLRKRKGRLFILGVGGSAGNASHAVNDFRKLCQIEAYCPTDNVFLEEDVLIRL